MSPPTTLQRRIYISTSWRNTLRLENKSAIGQSYGGPEYALSWLETQLGLQRKTVSNAKRTLQYAARLKKAELKVCAESFALDAWGTAANLLQRRDDLLIWGWDGKDDKRLPALAHDLAATEAVEGILAPGTPERLSAA